MSYYQNSDCARRESFISVGEDYAMNVTHGIAQHCALHTIIA
jgi:hypothetical protein